MKKIPYSCNKRLKMAIFLKEIYKFNAIPTKIPIAFFSKMENWILKFMWNSKNRQSKKQIKTNTPPQSWRTQTPSFKTDDKYEGTNPVCEGSTPGITVRDPIF